MKTLLKMLKVTTIYQMNTKYQIPILIFPFERMTSFSMRLADGCDTIDLKSM